MSEPGRVERQNADRILNDGALGKEIKPRSLVPGFGQIP